MVNICSSEALEATVEFVWGGGWFLKASLCQTQLQLKLRVVVVELGLILIDNNLIYSNQSVKTTKAKPNSRKLELGPTQLVICILLIN